MENEKLLKQVFLRCKSINENVQSTWCGGTRKLLSELLLSHVWSSENVGSRQDWEKVIFSSIRAREIQTWKDSLQKKPKLRLYRTLKSDLRRESYLALPLESRRRLTELRCGTHCLRIETGRWENEAVEERVCKVCVCGPIEDEVHVLLECYPYQKLREKCSRQSTRRLTMTRG